MEKAASSDKLTHFNEQGRARMVDVSDKEITARAATGCNASKISISYRRLARSSSRRHSRSAAALEARCASSLWLRKRKLAERSFKHEVKKLTAGAGEIWLCVMLAPKTGAAARAVVNINARRSLWVMVSADCYRSAGQ